MDVTALASGPIITEEQLMGGDLLETELETCLTDRSEGVFEAWLD